MLNTMTPQQFDEWLADYMIHSWDDEEFSKEKANTLQQSLQVARRLAGV